MAKYDLRIEARRLRSQGESVKSIAVKLGISKSSASIWVRDIILTIEQLEVLKNIEILGKERGRLKSALLQKERRQEKLDQEIQKGIKTFANLTYKEILFIGIALYWAEGSKKSREVEFCNSDPNMIKFWVNWLKVILNVSTDELRCRVGINEIHSKRDTLVKDYWSQVTGVPLSQFTKTNFKQSINKKVYDNHDQHFGTLSVSVLRPSRFYCQIIGLIEGLRRAG